MSTHLRPALLAGAVLLAAVALAACSSGDDDSEGTATPAGTSTVAATTEAGGSGATTSGNDACAALPRDIITEITGADPGEGELEHAASSTICRYYGDTILTVEIDPGSDVGQAQVSLEAYGKTCEAISDIGDTAIFCTSPPVGLGATGEVVWTDGDHTFYVEYNSGETDATLDIPLALAKALQP